MVSPFDGVSIYVLTGHLMVTLLIWEGSRTKLLWIDMVLFVSAAGHNGALSGKHITYAISALALSSLAVR